MHAVEVTCVFSAQVTFVGELGNVPPLVLPLGSGVTVGLNHEGTKKVRMASTCEKNPSLIAQQILKQEHCALTSTTHCPIMRVEVGT